MTSLPAFAKINLALLVGPGREDGMHEVVTVLERVALHDDLLLEPAPELSVEGFAEDSLVAAALCALGEASGTPPGWRVRIEKRIPVAAGLGGGSADAATALRLANAILAEPLALDELHRLAARLGADVPFFLREGAQLATREGTILEPVRLPSDYCVVLVLPRGARKASTEAVYRDFDGRDGFLGFDERRGALLDALRRIEAPRDLALLPPNDLVSSPLAQRLRELGAFRADVTGAGPAVYGLFEERGVAEQAARVLEGDGRTWLTEPVSDASGKMRPGSGA